MNFSDKHIVVTGGMGSLGTAVTGQLLEQGANVSIPAFVEAAFDEFEFKDHPNMFIQTGLNLVNEAAAKSFYNTAVEKQGSLWASVNVAGGFAMGKVESSTKQDLMKQLNLNLVTCFNACKAAVAHIKGHEGHIVTVSSRPGIEPEKGAGRTPYAISKAGVAALTKSLAAEVLDDDILVNAIAPSVIDTPQNREAMPNANFDKWPKPKEIAEEILYLISDTNTLTSGEVLPVYGKA